MKTKKYYIYSILVILLLVVVVSGATYAYFVSNVITNGNSIQTNGANFDIIYAGGTQINGVINIGSSKDDGYNTTVNIRSGSNTPNVRADLYINIDEITSNIAIEGFVWEVYGYNNGELVYSDTGDFDGCNSSNNNKVKIVDNYLLSQTDTSFTVYFWIDGTKTDNNVLNGQFRGYIYASSEQFKAVLQ